MPLSFSYWLFITLIIPDTLSQKQCCALFPVLSLFVLSIFSPPSYLCLSFSCLSETGKKGGASTPLKCSGRTKKESQKEEEEEEEEAKLCSQWHRREAERALETKSGNSTDRKMGWEKWGKTHAHPLIHHHTQTERSGFRPMTSSVQVRMHTHKCEQRARAIWACTWSDLLSAPDIAS